MSGQVEAVDDLHEQLLGHAPWRLVAELVTHKSGIGGKVDDQDAQAPPRQSWRAEGGPQVDAVVPLEVGFDGLPVLGQEPEEASPSPRSPTPSASRERMNSTSSMADPPAATKPS